MPSQINNKNKNKNKQSQNNLEKYGFTSTTIVSQNSKSEINEKKNIALDLENCSKLDTYGFTAE